MVKYFSYVTQVLALVSVIGLTACQTQSDAPSDTILSSWTDQIKASCRIENIRTEMLETHNNQILVVAHRGHHDTAPENSIASIISAAKIEADIVEIDVLLSKDGIPVLMHDETVDRTTNGTGKVSDLTLIELKDLRLISPEGEMTDSFIPTLREALSAAKNRIFVDIDLKISEVIPVVQIVREMDMVDEVMFYNSNANIRNYILNLEPDSIVFPIARSKEDVEELVTAKGLKVLHLLENFNSSEVAKLLDTYKVAGWTNSLGEPDDLVLKMGAETAFSPIIKNQPDLIQTDRPRELVAYLRKLKLHWTYNRDRC